MSGTSMDGLDLACCELIRTDSQRWDYKILAAETISYDERWRLRLSKLRNQSAIIFHKTDRYFGEFIGQQINAFIQNNQLGDIDLISSHGHTIFHRPEENLTTQIGSGASISAITGLPVVCDFRAMDVVLGGEGAPLAGLGDQFLFGEFDICLNLGGFANISAQTEQGRIAYDICPANIVLNRIAREFGQAYDEGGAIAEQGKIDYDLLSDLNSIDYYQMTYPKSLGREWINEAFWFRVRESEASKEDKMKTLVDHIAEQIANNIEQFGADDPALTRVFVSGGGAFNKTLIDHLRSHTEVEIIIPEEDVIMYKEALIFALLGVLRVRNEINVYASATGAEKNSVSGSLHGNFSQLIG